MISKRYGLTIIELLIVLGILVVLTAFLLPATRSAPEAARRNTCLNNLKQISLAFHNYHDVHGTFPPAYTIDADGNRLHSWRTLILPYMEEQELYESIDLTKPWDDPVNAKAHSTLIDSYLCPSLDIEPTNTTYKVIVDTLGVFTGSEGTTISSINDTANTIVLIDMPQDHAVHWMSPMDTDVEAIKNVINAPNTNQHYNVRLVGFADGHLAAIDKEIDVDVLAAHVNKSNGLKLELP